MGCLTLTKTEEAVGGMTSGFTPLDAELTWRARHFGVLVLAGYLRRLIQTRNRHFTSDAGPGVARNRSRTPRSPDTGHKSVRPGAVSSSRP